jgi:transcriptional regulator with XRE-family HTH domain
LWEWRTRHGLSLGQLAQAAGVHKSALSRWEAGMRQPRVTELEATLRALDVSAAESALAFACIPAPRAVRHLKEDLAAVTGSPLTKGDLLRALRLRQGWTQAQVAHEVGVSHQQVARWERMECLPSHEQIHALCYALGARLEEVTALTTGSFAEPPETKARIWEETEEEVNAVIQNLLHHDLGDLHYFSLDEKFWRWSLRHEEARHWLLRLRIYHAHEHRLRLRWEMAELLLNKAREVVPEAEMGLELRLRHAILSARIAVYSGHHPAPERGIRLLQPWAEKSREQPAHQAWLLSNLAKYAALQRVFDRALLLAEQACAVAEQSGQWAEIWLRCCDYGALLVEAGRPEEALGVIPCPRASEWNGVRLDPVPPSEYLAACLPWAEAHCALGNLSEARRALSVALEILETTGIPEEKQRAAALAARLQAREAGGSEEETSRWEPPRPRVELAISF